jgi:hypothetical protein
VVPEIAARLEMKAGAANVLTTGLDETGWPSQSLIASIQ